MHFCGAGYVIAELIDPHTGAVKKMRDGETGELVYTAIKRQASPLLRLRSHDLVEVQSRLLRMRAQQFSLPCARAQR